MLFQEFLSGHKHDATWVFVSDGFNIVGLNGVCFIAEAVADESEYGCHFIIAKQSAERSHRYLPVVFFTVDLEGANQAIESELDKALIVAADPCAVRNLSLIHI